jgi:hypothetical protein
MNKRSRFNFSGPQRNRNAGITLLDVLMGIVIFVIGMLALASLQGNLTRSSSDGNARTIATNVAEGLIERFRTFETVESEAGMFAYQDIVTHSLGPDVQGGVEYTVDVTVEDFYFINSEPAEVTNDPDDDRLPEDRDISIPDFKYVQIAVNWAAVGFQGAPQDNPDTAADESRLGSGEFTVTSIVPPVSPFGSAKVAAEDSDAAGTPPVFYTPGEAPEVLPINLPGSKFKESTTPEPVVWRKGELIETWFDVITYNQVGGDAIFERREEFASISCKCTMAGDGEVGRLPTIWDGADYVEGKVAFKPYGTLAASAGRQSQYCEVCCKDHHDAGGGVSSYRPFAINFTGNHPHYNRDNNGNLVQISGAGDDYIEACRLVRKDGFFRVAQDFNLEEINAFPENYPVASADQSEYSEYVKDVAHAEQGPGVAPGPANIVLSFDGRDPENPSDVPPFEGVIAVGQQLRSRGIYLDAVTPGLTQTIEDCFGAGLREDCKAPNADSVYELYPFFDVQLTQLARWTETQPNDPIEITNQEIAKDYSRGKAEQAGSKIGLSVGQSKIEKGNAGLISILPVSMTPPPGYKEGDIHLRATEGEPPPVCDTCAVITGTISSTGDVLADATVLVLEGSVGVSCTKPTNETFECIIDPALAGSSPTLRVSNYTGGDYLVCGYGLTLIDYQLPLTCDPLDEFCVEPVPNIHYTDFSLPTTSTSGISLVISPEGSCGG